MLLRYVQIVYVSFLLILLLYVTLDCFFLEFHVASSIVFFGVSLCIDVLVFALKSCVYITYHGLLASVFHHFLIVLQAPRALCIVSVTLHVQFG